MKCINKGEIKMKNQGEPIAALCALAVIISLRFTVKRVVKKYSGVKL